MNAIHTRHVLPLALVLWLFGACLTPVRAELVSTYGLVAANSVETVNAYDRISHQFEITAVSEKGNSGVEVLTSTAPEVGDLLATGILIFVLLLVSDVLGFTAVYKFNQPAT